MFGNIQSIESTETVNPEKTSSDLVNEHKDEDENKDKPTPAVPQESKSTKTISVGDSLPYGIRLYYGTSDNVVRMKDVGVKKRILVLGVTGSFTPYCWNRHLFRVLQKPRYYEERDIDYICCISTNDPYTQRAWASYLGCDETVLMFSDLTTRYTKALGMDVVIPWLDDRVRSRRYLIYAEDMIVLKMIMADKDGPELNWRCEHLMQEEEADEGEVSSESDPWNIH